MSVCPYLDMLDEMLHRGMAGLSKTFVDAQVGFVIGCRRPDGGFRGRRGDSDLYYTDFALRTLALLAPGHAAFDRAAVWLTSQTGPRQSIVDCFGILNVHRMTGSRPPDAILLREQLDAHLLPQGGFARFRSDGHPSAYATFLGDLCFQMLGEEPPAADDAIRAVEGLQRPDGGYVELDGQPASQTSATAAAVAFLTMHNAVMPAKIAITVEFLSRMQNADGGLMAHATAGGGDLLSTFTGLLTLKVLDGLDRIDMAGMAEFLRSAAHPDGGFSACLGDSSPDVEYTYYGVSTFALLRTPQNTGQAGMPVLLR